MKNLGLALVMLAFLAGAFLSVLDPSVVMWRWMVPVLLAGAGGLWLHRKARHAETRSGHRLSGNMDTLQNSLENIVANLRVMDEGKKDLPVYEARFEIDRLFRDDLTAFAEARESMIHVFGMRNYADVMSAFAAGERYINRVWSASADGYTDEVQLYISRARTQFEEANELFAKLRFKSTTDRDSLAAT